MSDDRTCHICGAITRTVHCDTCGFDSEGRDGAYVPPASPEALDLRHAGHARLLSEAEIREAEAERGGRL